MVVSVKRAVAILRSFSLEEPELGVTELSRRLKVHKSTVSRLLYTLQEEGIVDRNAETRKFRLGVGLLGLANLVLLQNNLRQIARPILVQLSESTQETVNLAIYEDDEAINIEQVTPPQRRISSIGWVGRHTPLHASSTGKVLLAYRSEKEMNDYFHNPLTRYTENTITDAKKLHAELKKTIQRGYATGIEELEIGLTAVAAPIRNHTGQVIAALSVSGPSYRLPIIRLEEVSQEVIESALVISLELGYSEKTYSE